MAFFSTLEIFMNTNGILNCEITFDVFVDSES